MELDLPVPEVPPVTLPQPLPRVELPPVELPPVQLPDTGPVTDALPGVLP